MKKTRHRPNRDKRIQKPPVAMNERMDPRAAESTMWAIEHKMRGQEFENYEAANAFLSRLNESQDFDFEHESPLEDAQALMYTAFGLASRQERIRLANHALSLSEDCADAYVLLAEEAEDEAEQQRLYELGVQAGERACGPLLDEEKGHLWRTVRARPYLRALMGLADVLGLRREWESACKHYESLLELDTSDAQGARFQLLLYVMYQEKYDDALQLIKRYGDDACDAAYSKVFIWFLKRGDVYLSRSYLDEAFEVNRYVPLLLWDPEYVEKKLRKTPDMASDLNDAQAYVDGHSILWARHADAYDWIIQFLAKKLNATE